MALDAATYGRVEESEENILNAIGGVGDTVNGLPASLEADFNEIKSAIADVKTVVDGINSYIGIIYTSTNETNSVVKDILNGTLISQWIDDLKASGTSSETYRTEDRMNKLISNSDAANNSDVAKYLVQWSAENNKFGIYCGSACGEVSGVTWDSLTSVDSVMRNSDAFKAVCGNSVAFTACMKVSSTKTSIVDNAKTTESVLMGSDVALSVLNGMKEKGTTIYSSKKRFLLYVTTEGSGVNATGTATPTYITGDYGSISITYSGQRKDVNRFINGGSQSGSPIFYQVLFE